MNSFDEASVTYCQAIQITANYLLKKGYSERAAWDNAQVHVISLFNDGEWRPLALANLAISAIEQEERFACVILARRCRTDNPGVCPGLCRAPRHAVKQATTWPKAGLHERFTCVVTWGRPSGLLARTDW